MQAHRRAADTEELTTSTVKNCLDDQFYHLT